MATIKFTKNELRSQQLYLATLRKYLPTLQLKKAMLQTVVSDARVEFHAAEEQLFAKRAYIETYSMLLAEKIVFNLIDAAKPKEIYKRFENIAGIEVPYFNSMTFEEFAYPLFDTPPWVDGAILEMRLLAEAAIKMSIAGEKVVILEKELRDVSIKVNLFEKILIPRALQNIRKIKVFLGDQQLAAVCQAKVAKKKIIEHKKTLVKEEGESYAH